LSTCAVPRLTITEWSSLHLPFLLCLHVAVRVLLLIHIACFSTHVDHSCLSINKKIYMYVYRPVPFQSHHHIYPELLCHTSALGEDQISYVDTRHACEQFAAKIAVHSRWHPSSSSVSMHECPCSNLAMTTVCPVSWQRLRTQLLFAACTWKHSTCGWAALSAAAAAATTATKSADSFYDQLWAMVKC